MKVIEHMGYECVINDENQILAYARVDRNTMTDYFVYIKKEYSNLKDKIESCFINTIINYGYCESNDLSFEFEIR